MTIVEGQIEPLKKIKDELERNNISRFSSIADINRFTESYESELSNIPLSVKEGIETELRILESQQSSLRKIYLAQKAEAFDELNSSIKVKEESLAVARGNSQHSSIKKIFLYPRIRLLTFSKSRLEKRFQKILDKKTSTAKKRVEKVSDQIYKVTSNKESIQREKEKEATVVLKETKGVIDNLYPLIAGAIGENAVVNQLKELSDDHYLINDFSMKFDPPIYNKKKDDRIFSIQIDHLLISASGLYIIETKNWSKQSITSLNLRSPVEQILRTSYALFVYLNSDKLNNNIDINNHHWGNKKIPIKNIIVMTNQKPTEEFQHVKVLSLRQLNGYISYFEKSFSNNEIQSIFNQLRKVQS